MKIRFRIIIQILYPFIFAFFIWLCFFEPEIKETGLSEIWQGLIICGGLLGCSMFVYHSFEEKQQNKVRTFLDKLFIIIGFLGWGVVVLTLFAVFLLPISTGIISSINVLFTQYQPLFIVFAVVIVLSSISILVLYLTVNSKKHFKSILTLRIITWLLVLVGCLIFSYSTVRLFIYSVTNGDNRAGAIGYASVIIFILSVIAIINVIQNQRLFSYEEKDFILYLRSFRAERKTMEIKNQTIYTSLPVLAIGNPNSIIHKEIGTALYVPTKTWKKQVNYYIEKSRLVYAVLDSTDGLLWEIMEHLNYREKFVYFLPNAETRDKILEMDGYNENSIVVALRFFKKNNVSCCAFRFINDNCLYSSVINDVIYSALGGETVLESFVLNGDMNAPMNDELSNSDVNIGEVFSNIEVFFLNSRRSAKRVVKQAITFMAEKGLYGFFFILIKGFGVLLIIGGLFGAFWPEVPWLEARSIGHRIFYFILSGFGYRILESK